MDDKVSLPPPDVGRSDGVGLPREPLGKASVSASGISSVISSIITELGSISKAEAQKYADHDAFDITTKAKMYGAITVLHQQVDILKKFQKDLDEGSIEPKALKGRVATVLKAVKKAAAQKVQADVQPSLDRLKAYAKTIEAQAKKLPAPKQLGISARIAQFFRRMSVNTQDEFNREVLDFNKHISKLRLEGHIEDAEALSASLQQARTDFAKSKNIKQALAPMKALFVEVNTRVAAGRLERHFEDTLNRLEQQLDQLGEKERFAQDFAKARASFNAQHTTTTQAEQIVAALHRTIIESRANMVTQVEHNKSQLETNVQWYVARNKRTPNKEVMEVLDRWQTLHEDLTDNSLSHSLAELEALKKATLKLPQKWRKGLHLN